MTLVFPLRWSMLKMDKKTKKRLEVIRGRVEKLQQQLSGVRQQEDEPGEAKRLEDEIKVLEAEREKLKASK